MKKHLLIIFLFARLTGFSQHTGTYWGVDSLSTVIGKNFYNPAKFPLVYVRSIKTFFQVTDTVLTTQTMTQVIAANSCTFVASSLYYTDTVTWAPVGTICFKVSDSTFYGKIRLTGPKSARWKTLN